MSSAEIEAQKQAAAEAAALLVEDGMKVGLGTGSTVAYLLPALARRALREVRYVATSPRTEAAATALGLHVEPFALAELDVAIDGADQVAPDDWLIKGGGGAHTRERLVAAAARRFVVIASGDKPVEALRRAAAAGAARLRAGGDARAAAGGAPAARHAALTRRRA